MGRRSDHSRAELADMILAEGQRHMADVGYAGFSAREVAKRIGYSIGTLYNVFGSHDLLVLAINVRTLERWADALRTGLHDASGDRIEAMARAYFNFAAANPQAWAALYDHRMPPGQAVPDWYRAALAALLEIVFSEIERALPGVAPSRAAELGRSLLALVHGHCVWALNGTFALLGEAAPLEAALARIHEAIAAAR